MINLSYLQKISVLCYCWVVLFLVKTLLKMTGKKRKIDLENRAFKDEWTKDYFFVQDNGKSLCLICMETIAAIKVDNIKRHYNSKHALKFDSRLTRRRKSQKS